MKTMRSILLFTYHIWSIKTNCQKRSCQKCASVKVANTFPTTLTCIWPLWYLLAVQSWNLGY